MCSFLVLAILYLLDPFYSPPMSWYSRKPIVILSAPRPTLDSEQGDDFQDDLDRHVDDVLNRPAKIRRTLKGVWSFLKTRMSGFRCMPSRY